MNPAGYSGTGESNSPHTEGERFGENWDTQQSDLPPDALIGEMGEPAGDIEIVAVEMTALPPSGLEGDLGDLGQTGTGWFRWWYVPAVVVPAAAGVATALWLINRRRQPAVVQTYNGLADRVGDWWGDLTGQNTRKQAKKTVKRGVKSARTSAVLASASATNLAERAGDTVRDALDDASDAVQDAFDRVRALWERNAPSTSTAKRQAQATASQASGALAGLWQMIAGRFEGLNPQAQVASARTQARSTLGGATAPVMNALSTAGARTSDAVQSVGDSVSSTARAIRAFTFGAIVSSIATYLGITRRRAGKAVARETASGRQLPGYWPRFGNRAQQTTAAGRSRR